MGRPLKKKYIGLTATAGNQIQVRVKIGSNAEANGSIIKQKGSARYYVTDGTNRGICKLANLANASLTANTCTITATTAAPASFKVKKMTNRIAESFAGVRYKWTFGSAVGSGALSTVTITKA